MTCRCKLAYMHACMQSHGRGMLLCDTLLNSKVSVVKTWHRLKR